MEFRQVEYFLRLYESKNMTHAGKELFISQQALSKAIQKLEAELGFTLFIRIPTGVVPTYEAKQLYEHFVTIKDSYSSFMHVAASLRSPNLLRITAMQGFALAIEKQLFSEYVMLHPELDIHYIEYPNYLIPEYLINHEADIAFLCEPLPDSVISYHVTSEEQIYAVMDSNHPYAKRDSLSINDLTNQPLMLLDVFDNIQREILERMPSACTVVGTVHMLEFLQIIRNSRFIGFSVKSIYQYYNFPEISFVPLFWEKREPVKIRTHLVTTKDQYLTPVMEEYIQYIKNHSLK